MRLQRGRVNAPTKIVSSFSAYKLKENRQEYEVAANYEITRNVTHIFGIAFKRCFMGIIFYKKPTSGI